MIWVRGITLGIVLTLLVALLTFNTPAGHVRTEIDDVTGSLRTKRTWLAFRMPSTIQPSAVEQWLVQREPGYQPHWVFLSAGDTNLLGWRISCYCGRTPELYELHAGFLNDRFVAEATDSELADFVTARKSEDEARRRQAVATAYEIVARGDAGRK